jgi:hypothetical protein
MVNLIPGRKPKPGTDVQIPANPPVPVLKARSQVAAASRITFKGTGWKNYKFGTNLWQLEAWRHYDICGELHGVTNAVANLGSRVEFNIHRIVNGKPGPKVTAEDDPVLAGYGDQILGGPDKAPENQRLAFVNLFVAGEYFQFVESPTNETVDRWFIVSVTQLTRAQDGSGKLQFDRPHEYGGGKVDYDPNDGSARSGILERCWTPHGQLSDHSDSSVRSAITVLNLIEQYNKRQSAQNDSRLAGAGALLLPDSFDFPAGDDQSPVDAFEARLGTEMGRTLEDPANARSLVPVMATVNGDDIDKVKWLTFETPLDEQTKDRLDQCIRRLATSLDVPPSVLLGGESSSHWTAWKDAEDTVTTFVAPLAARVAACATDGWLRPILIELGYDPTEYMIWYDLAPLLVKPDRHADAMALWDRGLINDEAARSMSGVKEADAHTPESYKAWMLAKLILAGSPLLTDPNTAAQLGIIATAPAPETPAIEAANDIPERTEPPRSPEQEALVAGAEMAALHSLAVAGKKMLTRGVRDQLMTEFAGRPFDLHTRLTVDSMEHAATLLDGTWDLLPALSARTGTDQRILRDVLGFYCASQMSSNSAHNPDTLTFLLSEGILAAGHRRCTHELCGNRLHPQECTAPKPVAA